jgi:hypothetical protein
MLIILYFLFFLLIDTIIIEQDLRSLLNKIFQIVLAFSKMRYAPHFYRLKKLRKVKNKHKKGDDEFPLVGDTKKNYPQYVLVIKAK